MGGEKEWFLSMLESNGVVILILTVLTFILLRFLYVIHQTGKPLCPTSAKPLSTLIVLGSGGHTAEMLNLLAALQKDRFYPRYYIAAATDNMSLQKARTFESSSDDEMGKDKAEYMQIYRSREVGQSYITSVGTTLVAIAHALWLMIKVRPQVILCNGPGTCIPICAIAFFKIQRFLHLCTSHHIPSARVSIQRCPSMFLIVQLAVAVEICSRFVRNNCSQLCQ
uniref:UDP-N-acetylglucosamine transferase subunit ALG14 n=1 Tax=Opuntia streptacantha TaxID=393608 RepID=A0A7C9FPD2_OPUST